MDEEIKNLQLDKPGRGKSPEQIRKHSIHESFANRPVERALYLLTKGDEVQKISIIQALPQLLQIDENATYTRILPKIQQELPNSSCEFHINASKVFQQFLEKPKSPGNLLTAVLQGIESRDLIVVNAWLETLIAVIPTLHEDSIRKEIMPIVLTKASLTQPVMSRIATCSIVGKIAIHPKFKPLDVKKDVLPVVQSLCQDVQPEVRAAICSQLANVAQGLGTEFVKAHLLPCLVELASDNNPNVRSAAISSIVNILPHTTADTKKGTIVPLVKKLFESAMSFEDVTAGAVAKEIGVLLQGLLSSLNSAETVSFLQCYKTLARRGISTRTGDARFGDPSMDVICRDRCAYNLPAILHITVSVVPEQIDSMYTIFRDLGADPCYIVRRTVAGCIHEIAKILSAQNKMMKADIVRLLRDDAEEVLQTLTPNIGTTLELLCAHGVLSKEKADQATMEIGRAMLKCHLELTKGYNWRLHTEYLIQLEHLPACVPADFIHQHFTPVVLSNALNGRSKPVRSQAVRTLLIFLRHNNKENQQKWLRDSLISELCYSNSSYTRRIYIMLCAHAMDIFNDKYFKDYFLIPLLTLADDPVSNIRYMFVNLLPQLNKMTNSPADTRLKQLISDAVTKLENQEKDMDVITNLRVKLKSTCDMDSTKKEQLQRASFLNYSVRSMGSTTPPPSVSKAGTRTSPTQAVRPGARLNAATNDMNFLEQHFYIDAGVNMPNVEQQNDENHSTKEETKKVNAELISSEACGALDLKVLQNSSTNITDDVKVNLRKISKGGAAKPAKEGDVASLNDKQDSCKVNKRHSSVYSASCLENQTRKANNRRSLNIQTREVSRIPISSSKSTKDLTKVNGIIRGCSTEGDFLNNRKYSYKKVNSESDLELARTKLTYRRSMSSMCIPINGESSKSNFECAMKENCLPTKKVSKLPQIIKPQSNLPLYIGRQVASKRK